MSQIIWFTGMSGAGKSTILEYANKYVQSKKMNTACIDGDQIRNKYKIPVGFSYDEICMNNRSVASLCKSISEKHDFIFVAVISPYEKLREEIKSLLNNNIHFVYVYADIDVLKKRDVKGLYKKADNGVIDNLIGYSKNSPYEKPTNPSLKINTSIKSLDECKEQIKIFIDSLLNQ
tara:strand:+ start:6944 stop:7471 length:528 start_codon:yes stop_codon:yes gene_type:complete